MKSKHDTELAERDGEIKRLRAQVAMLIGTESKPWVHGTCCGDATHGCMDDPTARMHG